MIEKNQEFINLQKKLQDEVKTKEQLDKDKKQVEKDLKT